MNVSQWAAHTFKIPKNNGTIRFIAGFRELNKTMIQILSQSLVQKI